MGREARQSAIVAVQRDGNACPQVTFKLAGETLAAPLVVTLTLCEWQRIARQVADATAALGA